ncbi:MAG: cell division protein [Gammaproteobacteria bacterium]|nr:cell division protein [Gammaproteobacteria bacterium]MBT7370902.1 cell division protein [Gammaproteobacteria bacterium]
MKNTGATVAVTGAGGRLRSWAQHHQRVFTSTIRELFANPVASLMTWLVIGIALALPAILYVMLHNISMISGDWGGKPRVSLFLAQEVSMDTGRELALRLEAQPGIEQIKFISSEQALKDFQHRSGFGEVLGTLERNPLPHVIEVVPEESDPIALSDMITSWGKLEAIERVSVDLQWLERLFALLRFAERLVLALAIVLGLGVMLIMGNTIRLAIENRRQEIEVVKLVGGTDGFVRRPFLYLGFWYGFGGALIAFLLVQLSLAFLTGPVETLAQSYRDDYALQGPGITGSLLLLLIGAALGVLGSVLAVSKHLADIEPQ